MALRRTAWLPFFLVVVAISAAPLVANDYAQSLLLTLFMYVVLALSWNIMSGYTGYLSFGHGVFFGTGAYIFAALVTMADWPFWAALLAAAAGAALVAFVLGLVFMRVRIRIAYFSIATLGLNEIVKTVVSTSDWLGSAHGMTLPPPPSSQLLYYLLFAVALSAFAVAAWIDWSKFGLGLKAILQDEEAAEAAGVPTFRCKLVVFVLSAIFPGMAGALIGWHLSYIDPFMAFDLSLSFDMATMVIFGGIGTLWGPVVGAVTMGILSEFLWVRLPNLHGLIYGALVLGIVVLAPGGIIQLVKSFQRQHRTLRSKAAMSAEPT